MENNAHEPQQPGRAAPHCSTPHSAPARWLRAGPEQGRTGEPPAAPPPIEPAGSARGALPAPSQPDPAEDRPQLLDQLAEIVRNDPAVLAEIVARASPEHCRKDGWTPFARKLFLQVLADTGRISRALAWTGLSKQSAHALRNRDPLFAAGWDAACLLARNPLADDMYEKGMDGVTDTVTRNGEVVATRHRYDSRLSMAVLNRLDKRCDRAEEQGSGHLAVMRRWEEWLDLVGKGDEQAARAIVESAPHGQFGQLAESANPIPIPDAPGFDPAECCWKDDDGEWLTTFPPPPGFDGHESGPWDGLNYYERACTPEEAALIEADQAQAEAEERAELTAHAEAQRDSYFATLRNEIRRRQETARCSRPSAPPSPPARRHGPA